jgi:hypothetical protein
MGSISFTITQTSKPDAIKTYTVPDADVDRLVAAYQSDANVSVNGTATRAQVLLYVAAQWISQIKAKVKSVETTTAQAAVVIPSDISAT